MGEHGPFIIYFYVTICYLYSKIKYFQIVGNMSIYKTWNITIQVVGDLLCFTINVPCFCFRFFFFPRASGDSKGEICSVAEPRLLAQLLDDHVAPGGHSF